MTFDLRRSFRRLKPQRITTRLRRRADADLPFASTGDDGAEELLLDTGVYIDIIQGRTPPIVEGMLQRRILNHSSVALAELTHVIGRLNPAHVGTKAALAEVGGILNDMPPNRLTAPSVSAFGEAGMLAGLLARLTDRGHDAALLNDALLLLHARETGRVLLTGNVADFDHLQQLEPTARVLMYRRA